MSDARTVPLVLVADDDPGSAVGDLGLIKLCGMLRGRPAEAEDTRELLEPYEEWAGLASVYLLASLPKTKGQPCARPWPTRPAS